MNNEKNKKLKQIIIGIICLVPAVLIEKFTDINIVFKLLIYLIPYIIVSFDIYKEAIEGFQEKEYFNEDLLMCIATLGALLIGFLPNSNPEFLEGVFVMLFFQIGELFEIVAEGNSRKSIKSLLEIRPDYANLLVNEKIEKTDPNKVKINDIIIVNPGEKIPLDGIVIEGNTSLNTVALTGESIPRTIIEQDEVMSGCINLSAQIKVKVTKLFGESTASKIIELVESANEKKSKNDKFITKFAKIYTPIVVIIAIFLAIIPSIITHNYVEWIKRSLTFLVVSCPCALVISVPLTYFGGIGGSAKKGVLIKGANYLEKLSKLDTIIFDKTGTLTKGVFKVTAIHPKEFDEDMLLHLAYHVEEASSHPIAKSLREAYKEAHIIEDNCKITEIKEITGLGVSAKVNNETVYVGNDKLMNKINAKYEKCNHIGTIIHIAFKSKYLGHIVISDELKDDSIKTIKELKNENIRTIMLTGDNEIIAKDIAKKLKINKYYSELLPENKVDKLNEIQTPNKIVAFVGDGINDAPVIAKSNIGISMGTISADAAIEAADIILMNDKISNLIEAIKTSKKTERIVLENIVFAILVKFTVLILSAIGLAPMWLAVFADVGVTVLDIFNAMRTLK